MSVCFWLVSRHQHSIPHIYILLRWYDYNIRIKKLARQKNSCLNPNVRESTLIFVNIVVHARLDHSTIDTMYANSSMRKREAVVVLFLRGCGHYLHSIELQWGCFTAETEWDVHLRMYATLLTILNCSAICDVTSVCFVFVNNSRAAFRI